MVSNVISVVGNLVVRANGTLCLRNGTSWVGGSVTAACTKTPLATGTTYDVRLHQVRGTGSDGVLEAYVAVRGAAPGAPFAATTTGSWTSSADRIAFGATTSVAVDATFDDVRIDGSPLELPAAPTDLAATTPSTSTAVDLAWVDAATNETSYIVERAADSTFASPRTFTLAANATSYRDTSVSAGTTYAYRVRAVNAEGASSPSNVEVVTTRAAPPAAPSSLQTTFASPTQTTLTWVDNSSNETGFTVERSATAGFDQPTAIALPANTTSYTDSGLGEGVYFYRVTATNGASVSDPSNVVGGPRIKDITFEDGSPSLVNAVSGASLNAYAGMVQETAAPLKGVYSARSPNVNGTYLEQTFSGRDDLYVSFYMSLAARPPADMRIALVIAGGVPVANLWLRASGALCLKYGAYWSGGTTTSACTTAPLATAPAIYRIGIHQRRGDGASNAVVEAFLAEGDAQFGSDATGHPLAFASSSIAPTAAGYWQAPAAAFRLGPTLSSGSLDARFDDIKLDSAFMPRASAAGTSSDATAPSVAVTAPSAGATVAGSVGVVASAADDVGVTKVELFAGTTLVGTATAEPYSFTWDTTTGANGSYALTAKAWDAAGNSTVSAPSTVTVANPTDATPPTTTIACAGTTCSTAWYTGPVAVTLAASDTESGVASTRYTTDGSTPSTSNGIVYTGGSITLAQTTTIKFRSWDAAGNVEGVRTAQIRIDGGAPTVTLTAPQGGATLAGTVTAAASATDDVGVTKVEFYAGTTLVGTATAAPYTVAWDTTTVPDGQYALTAKAWDDAGNKTTSAASTVTVSNAARHGAPDDDDLLRWDDLLEHLVRSSRLGHARRDRRGLGRRLDPLHHRRHDPQHHQWHPLPRRRDHDRPDDDDQVPLLGPRRQRRGRPQPADPNRHHRTDRHADSTGRRQHAERRRDRVGLGDRRHRGHDRRVLRRHDPRRNRNGRSVHRHVGHDEGRERLL